MSTESKLELVINARPRDLGGFSVRRILPYATHRMVGPFIFFDHMGPAEFPPGEGIGVRPHPHINLATVTYLFEGAVHHRDSLGSNLTIEPGAINWMTAGRGIVHSERHPEGMKDRSMKLNGIQLWVALPEEHEECEPSFSHHPKDSFPIFEVNGVKLKLLLGSALGRTSPVPVLSDIYYIEAHFPKGSEFTLETPERESAVYLVDGEVEVEGETLEAYSMAVGKSREDLRVKALKDSRVMLLGGKPLGKRFIYWNFVSSSQKRIEEAKKDWEQGPRASSPRFATIPGDDKEYIPLPVEPGRNPKGTIM